MTNYKNVSSLVQALQNALTPFIRKRWASVRVGKCLSVSGKTAVVSIGGAGVTTQRYCDCKANDTVLVLAQGNTFYTVGVKQ